jgi:hypothetical protein
MVEGDAGSDGEVFRSDIKQRVAKKSWALFNLSGGLYDGELYPSLSPSTGAWSGKAVCEAEDAAGTHTKEARREE